MLWTFLLIAQGIATSGQTGVVSGHISDIDGTPAAHVRVGVQAAAPSATPVSDAFVLSNIIETDAQGNFRIDGIPPGKFYVVAGMIDLPTYNPGVTSIFEARAVDVTVSSPVTGIDFKLARPAGWTVRGHVIVESGATMPSTAVLMANAFDRNMVVPPDGNFTFERVLPGRYTVGVLSPAGSKLQEIVVTDKNLDIPFRIQAAVAASGRLVVEGGGPRPRIVLMFSSETASIVFAAVGPDGTFNTPLRPGTYHLSVNGIPSGYRLASVSAGSDDWTRDNIVVKIGTPIPAFVVVLKSDRDTSWAKVKGHVSGVLAPGLVVSLAGRDAGEILRSEVQRDGTFEFPAVLPGMYAVGLEGSSAVPDGRIGLQIPVGSSDVEGLEIPQSRDSVR